MKFIDAHNKHRIVPTHGAFDANYLVVSPDGDIVERCHNRQTAEYFKRKFDLQLLADAYAVGDESDANAFILANMA
jgi:hypothetical protein